MSKDLSKNITELNDSVKEYLSTKVDLVKLSILEKTTRFVSYVISFQILSMLIILIIAFVAVIFAVWYGQAYNNLINGLFIVSGFLVLLVLIFVLMRNKIITSNLLKNFADIMLEEDKKDN